MTTKMERATEKVALRVLQRISTSAEPPILLEKLKSNFYTAWPQQGSRFPINDAMRAALQSEAASKEGTPSRRRDEGRPAGMYPMTERWEHATAAAIEEYFQTAEQSFSQGNPLDGTEALTDAVRTAIGHIAATREWPHGTRTDLYDATTALATGTMPLDDENVSELLDAAPEEGINLCSAFAASMGQPKSVKFGLFYDSNDGCNQDATMFARMTVDLARRLAKVKTAAP